MLKKNKLILVTGATGAVGPRVVQALDKAGYYVRTFSVDAPTAGTFPANVEVVLGNVTDKASVQSAMQGVDAVVHMAALLHIVNPPPEMRRKYEQVNVGGTEIVVDAAVSSGVSRVVLFSTIAVYGRSYGRILDEQSPTYPDTFYAQTKLAAEKIVLDAKNQEGQSLGTVLRVGAVYGSRIKGNYERLRHALEGHRFLYIGNGLNRRTLVYDKDVGNAVVLAITHPSAAGRVFNVTDGTFHTLNEIVECICFALGRKLPLITLPVGPVRTLIRFISTISLTFGFNPPITQDVIDKYTEDIAVDGSKIKNELGFMPKYDLLTGWEEAIREMLI